MSWMWLTITVYQRLLKTQIRYSSSSFYSFSKRPPRKPAAPQWATPQAQLYRGAKGSARVPRVPRAPRWPPWTMQTVLRSPESPHFWIGWAIAWWGLNSLGGWEIKVGWFLAKHLFWWWHWFWWSGDFGAFWNSKTPGEHRATLRVQ